MEPFPVRPYCNDDMTDKCQQGYAHKYGKIHRHYGYGHDAFPPFKLGTGIEYYLFEIIKGNLCHTCN